MTTTTWTDGNGNFNTPANWSAGVPTAGVDAIINGPSASPLTVSYTSGAHTANSLSTSFATLAMSGGSLTLQNASNMSGGFTESAGLLDFQNGGNNAVVSTLGPVSQTGGTLEVDAGQLNISGASSFAGTLSGNGTLALRNGFNYALNAGTTLSVANLDILDNSTAVTLGTNLTYAGSLYEWNNASINLGAHTLTLTGSDALHGLITATTGKLVASGNLVADNLVLGGGMTLQNTKTLATASGFTLGDSAASTAHLVNSRVVNFTGDNGISRNGNTTIANFGTIEKTGGAGFSFVDPNVTSYLAGKIIANSGNLYFRGGGTFSGAFSGTALVSLGGGAAYALNAGTTLSVTSLDILDNSTAVTLRTSLSYAGSLYEWNNASINLGANTLTLSGNDSLHGLITGTGRIVSSGSLVADNMVLGGAVTLENKGTVSSANGLTLGGSPSSTAQILNDAGAVIDFTGDNGIGRNGNTTITNGGTMEKTGGVGNSFVDPSVTSTGSVIANSGNLYFRGGGTFSGAINGSAIVSLGGGAAYALNAGTTLSVTSLDILDNSTSITLGTSLSYAGSLYEWNNASINLGANTLTLSGNDALHGLITGTGRIVSSGSLVADNLVLGGAVTLENKGTVSSANGLTLGDSPSSTAQILNDAGAVIDFTGDNGIGRNGNTTITNDGTLEKTGGSSNSFVDPNVTSTGSVIANSGNLYFRGSGTFSGAISGTALVSLGGGAAYALNTGTTLNAANLDILDNSTSITLGTSLSYAGSLYEWNNASINLGANTLTLSGNDSLHGLITGAGRIVSSSSVAADNLVLGGAVTLENKRARFPPPTVLRSAIARAARRRS